MSLVAHILQILVMTLRAAWRKTLSRKRDTGREEPHERAAAGRGISGDEKGEHGTLEELKQFFHGGPIGKIVQKQFDPEAILLAIKRLGAIGSAPGSACNIHNDQQNAEPAGICGLV